jgi:hypothetical protein
MQPLKAQVKNGHFVIDEPTDLPEGQVIYLVPVDDGDDVDDRDLLRALDASVADAQARRLIDADQLLDELSAKT